MADISQITLDGVTYNVKDAQARTNIETINDTLDDVEANINTLYLGVGQTPKIANLLADMTDTSKIYVYLGSETGHTTGNWWYYNTTNSEWTDSGQQYQAGLINTDDVLQTTGAAADAKATGDAIRSLQQTLSSVTLSVVGSSENFEQGAIVTSTTADNAGQNTTSNGHIRTKTVLPLTCYAVECANGWSAAYYAYSGDTYIGCWDQSTGTFGSTRTFYSGRVYLADISTEYTFRIVIKKNVGGYIDVEEAAPNIVILSSTDVTLSHSGVMADAKTTGDRISALEEQAVRKRWEGTQSIGDNLLDVDYTRLGYFITASQVKAASAEDTGMSNLIPVKSGTVYNFNMEQSSFGKNSQYVAFYPLSVTEQDDVTARYTILTATTIDAYAAYQIIPSLDGYIRINRKNSWSEQWFGVAHALATSTSKNNTTDAPETGDPTVYVYMGATEVSGNLWIHGHEYDWVVDSENNANNAWVDMGTYVYQTGKRSFIPSPGSGVDAVPNVLYGKKIACDGASIMAGNESYVGGYAKMIALSNDMIYAINAVGGATLATETYTAGGAARHWVSSTIGLLPDGYDYYIFDGAANDIDVHVPFGTPANIDDYDVDTLTASLDKTTFAGAFEYCCIILATKYGAAKHGYVIPHRKRMGTRVTYIPDPNDSSLVASTWRAVWLETWKPFIKNTLAKWGIACLDLEEIVPPIGLITDLKNSYTVNGDGTHPTANAYELFYKDAVEAWLRTL